MVMWNFFLPCLAGYLHFKTLYAVLQILSTEATHKSLMKLLFPLNTKGESTNQNLPSLFLSRLLNASFIFFSWSLR